MDEGIFRWSSVMTSSAGRSIHFPWAASTPIRSNPDPPKVRRGGLSVRPTFLRSSQQEFKRNSLSRSAISNKFSQHIAHISFRLNIFLAINLTYVWKWYKLCKQYHDKLTHPTFKNPTLLLVTVTAVLAEMTLCKTWLYFISQSSETSVEQLTRQKFSSLSTNYRVSNTNYTDYGIQCHQFYLSCFILLQNRGIVSPTLNVNPTLLVIPCNILGDYRVTMLQSLSLTKRFLIQISIIHDKISSQVVDKRRSGFDQGINQSIIQKSTCSLIYKRVSFEK